LAKAQQHAQDFINKRQVQIETLNTTMDRPPIIVAPYDAELFGHWWFEGPHWL
jgi:1,4-alpha-glucan branching enzyme